MVIMHSSNASRVSGRNDASSRQGSSRICRAWEPEDHHCRGMRYLSINRVIPAIDQQREIKSAEKKCWRVEQGSTYRVGSPGSRCGMRRSKEAADAKGRTPRRSATHATERASASNVKVQRMNPITAFTFFLLFRQHHPRVGRTTNPLEERASCLTRSPVADQRVHTRACLHHQPPAFTSGRAGRETSSSFSPFRNRARQSCLDVVE